MKWVGEKFWMQLRMKSSGVCFWQHHEFCFGCAVANDVAHDGEGGFVGDHEDGDAECCQGGGDIGDAERSVCLAYIGSVFKGGPGNR